MKSDYLRMNGKYQQNGTDGVKSAEGDNIKYPRVKKAQQVEDISASL